MSVRSQSHAPSGTNKTLIINEDSSYTIKVADFGFSDQDGNNFISVLISSLPPFSDGVYQFNGVNIIIGQTINITDINAGKLVFIPATDKNGNNLGGLSFQVQDNGSSNNTDLSANTLKFNINPINDAPVLGGVTTVTYTYDMTTATPFSTLTIFDVDSPAQTQTVTVTLDDPAKGTLSSSLGGGYDSATGVYSYIGTAAQAQTVIHGLIFTPTANRAPVGSTETTTFTVSVNDGIAPAVTDSTTTVVTTSLNDAPALGGAIANQVVSDNASLSPFLSFSITDPDIFQTETVTVALDNAAKGVLSSSLGGSYDSGTGVYSFIGTAAQAQAAIDSLVFTPNANRVFVGATETTTFTVSVTDGFMAAVDSTTTVVAISVNDAPVLGGAVANQVVNDNASLSPFLSFSITDPDIFQTETVTVALDNAAKGVLSSSLGGSYDSGTGVYSFIGTAAQAQAAIDSLVFTPNANRVFVGATETTTFTVSVNDGFSFSPVVNNTTTVVATSVNDAPVLGGITPVTIINDTATATPFSSITIVDVDSPAQTETVTVALDNAAKGILSSSLGGSYDLGTGVYSFIGTAAQAQAAIDSLIFTPTANRVPVGLTETTTFTVSVNDGFSQAFDSTTTVTVVATPVNVAPILTPSQTVTYTDTVFNDTFATATGTLHGTDSNGHLLIYGIAGTDVIDHGLTVSKIGTYGELTVTKATGHYSFVANDAVIEALNTPTVDSGLAVTASNGIATASQIFTIAIDQKVSGPNTATESNGNDTLTGTTGNDVFNALAGNDTVFGLAGNDSITGGEGADNLTGGLGKDTYYLAEKVQSTDIVHIASGDSLVTSFDVVNGFHLGIGRSTIGVDQLDLASTTISANVAGKNGIDSGIIHSHSISDGIISFDDINNYTTPLAIHSNNLADVFAYLHANITGNNTVAFVSEGNTYVFQHGGTNDTLVELVGVIATSISTTGSDEGAIWIS